MIVFVPETVSGAVIDTVPAAASPMPRFVPSQTSKPHLKSTRTTPMRRTVSSGPRTARRPQGRKEPRGTKSAVELSADQIGGNDMPSLKRRIGMSLVYFCLMAFGAQFLNAQTPTTWWPDPSTGLMWTGQVSAGPKGRGMTWQEAKGYCSSLQLGGYSGWRLPTLDEIKGISYIARIIPDYYYPPYEGVGLEGIDSEGHSYIWTSTTSGNDDAWELSLGTPSGGAFITIPLTEKVGAVCNRIAEADLLQVASDAQVSSPVSDILALKANVPLTKAELAYQAGQYQECIAQAKKALLLKPDFAPAYWAIGISYGMLGQWDLANTNLETSLKINKSYGDAKDGLKWAQQGRKAAKKGKNLRMQSPQWNWTLEPQLCYARRTNIFFACCS